jgi:DNA-binding LytR/AlgR family response regulator
LSKYLDKVDFIENYISVESAIDAINLLQKNEHNIDLIFLDVEMPEMDGMEFLGIMEEVPQVIVVSSMEKYALSAFEHDVTDYLLKPVTFSRFLRAINRAHEKLKEEKAQIAAESSSSAEQKEDNVVWIKNNARLEPINPNDILYIESLENYAVFFLFSERHTVHFTLKALTSKLPSEIFYRIHRSYIINIKKIRSIKGNTVEIGTKNGVQSLPLGKSYREKLFNDLNVLASK